MQSSATTVDAYLAEMPADRRAAIAAVRAVIRKNLPRGYEEGMQYGMIGYYVPHSAYPAGYHCDPRQPLPFACLASQKNYMSLYLTSIYMDDEQATAFRAAWLKTGKKLDMGKSCIRFKQVDDLPLELIAKTIKGATLKKHLVWYESVLAKMAEDREKRAAAKKSGKRPAMKKTPRPARATPVASVKKPTKKQATARQSK